MININCPTGRLLFSLFLFLDPVESSRPDWDDRLIDNLLGATPEVAEHDARA